METEKLFCPLDADVDNKKGPDSYLRREIMTQEDMPAYSGAINEALEKYQRMPDYTESPVQPLHGVGISVVDKITSRSISVEESYGKLWGVAAFEMTEALTPDEMDALKIFWEGEMSDGFGLDLATSGIPIDRGDLYLNFWAHGDDYFIAAEGEFRQRLERDIALEQIAKKHCRFETLETRKSDSLDFHEVSVWGLKAALDEAYAAGMAHQSAQTKGAEKAGVVHGEALPGCGPGAKASVLEQIRDAANLKKGRKTIIPQSERELVKEDLTNLHKELTRKKRGPEL